MSEGKETKKSKRKKTKKSSGDIGQNAVDISPDTKTDSKENLIMVGGIAGYDEEVTPRLKTFKEFREDALQNISERKNSKKRKSRNSGTVDVDDRQMKIQRLKKDETHWKGLE